MDPFQKNVFREKRAMSYKAKGTSEKDAYRKRNRESMKRKYNETNSPQNVKKQHDLDYYIS